MSRLGHYIKGLRDQRGLSLQEVADRATLSKGYVWEIESGPVSNPTINAICCLAVALDVLPDAISAIAISDCMDKLKVGTAQHKFVLPASMTPGQRE